MSESKKVEAMNLIWEWIYSCETVEMLKLGSDTSTTEEKQRIRAERLNRIVPELQKEYPLFSKRVKYQGISDNLYKISKSIPAKIGIYIVLSFITFTIIYELGLLDLAIMNLVVFVLPIILIMQIRVLAINLVSTEEVRKEYKRKDRGDLIDIMSIRNHCPYISAFLNANGLYYKKYYWRYRDPEGITLEHPLLLKEFKNLSFDEFINFVRFNIEPNNESYKDNDVFFNSIFFYLDEKTLQLNKKLRLNTKKRLKFYADMYDRDVADHQRSLQVSATYSNMPNNNYANKTSGNDRTSGNNRNNSNLDLMAKVNSIQSEPIRMCALYLTGQRNYKAGMPSFGGRVNEENWYWFTKSILESQEVYANRITDEDIRQAARAIITRDKYNYSASIRNRDVKELVRAIVDRDVNKYRIIQNGNLSNLARVLAEYGII